MVNVCPSAKGRGIKGSKLGGGELARHCQEFTPASRGRRARDAADVPQNRLKLLSCAVSYFRAERRDGGLVPLPSPAASHEGRVVRYDKECLEFASEFQHRAGGEMVDRNREIQGATGASVRGARAIAEDICLGPEPVTDRTSTYLGVRGV